MKPSLHAPVFKSLPHKAPILNTFKYVMAVHNQFAKISGVAPAAPSFEIPLTTVSLSCNFDAYINIRFRGEANSASTALLVNSGNSTLIVPDFSHIASLANFSADYQILAEATREPWGCPAKILRGPIEIPTKGGDVFSIPNCIFYACTSTNSQGERTSNFGAGWISPWPKAGNVIIQAPLTYNNAYPYIEFDYAPATTVMTAESQPKIVEGSSLILHQTMPSGYTTFEILRNLSWMSLIPRSLTIGNTKTSWPGNVPSPIAMVDTGGGPVFLSDPNGYLYSKKWPEQVPSPSWTSEGSESCQSVKDDLTIALGDGTTEFAYQIKSDEMPPSVQGLTLVICKNCYYMMENQGMNIGGVSSLFNSILIDYSAGKVGFKSKLPAMA